MIDSDLGTVVYTELTPDKRFTPICHECGSKAVGNHFWHQKPLSDLKLGHADNLIMLNYRKIYCPNCGIRVEKLNVTDPGGPKVTNRLARYIYELCKIMTAKEVADHLNLDWKTVKNVDKYFLEKEFGQTDYNHSGYLAIDEISVGKYHQYMTVVLDFKTGRVIWVGKDRKASTVDKFFNNMPQDQIEKINAFSMDTWDPYIKSIKK